LRLFLTLPPDASLLFQKNLYFLTRLDCFRLPSNFSPMFSLFKHYVTQGGLVSKGSFLTLARLFSASIFMSPPDCFHWELCPPAFFQRLSLLQLRIRTRFFWQKPKKTTQAELLPFHVPLGRQIALFGSRPAQRPSFNPLCTRRFSGFCPIPLLPPLTPPYLFFSLLVFSPQVHRTEHTHTNKTLNLQLPSCYLVGGITRGFAGICRFPPF